MENDNTTPQQPQQAQPPVVSKKKNIFIKTLLVLVALGLIAGAFFLGQKTTDSDGSGQARLENKQDATTENTSEKSEIHFVRSEGYPLDIDSMIVTNLGIPSGMQAVIKDSVISDPGETDIYALNFNEEMGRWLIGYPKGEGTHVGELSIIAILDEWLDTTNPENIDSLTGPKLNTPAEKKKYVEELKTKTTECVKSDEKGFTTEEGVFKVCYTLDPGYQDFSPILHIEGYGELAGETFFMLGHIPIYDGNSYPYPETGEKAREGTFPESISQVADSIVKALSQTTVEAQPRDN